MPTPTRKTSTLRTGTAVTTPGGYTAKIVGPDPKDASRVVIRYTGIQAHLGEDSYSPNQLRVVGAPPEIQEKPVRAKRSRKATVEPLTVYKPASDLETVEQGLKEGWIQPTGEVRAEQSCDRCQFQEIEQNCSEGKAFKCTQGKITGAIFVGGVIARELAKTCDVFQSNVEPELPWKFIPKFLADEQADLWMIYSQQVQWQHNEIKMFGRQIKLPRLEAIIGDGDYSYSGLTLKASPWTPRFTALKQSIEAETGYGYGICIGNQYRDGNDYIGWHSDDSPEMGKNPAIASLSLGATRKFQLRHKQTKQVHTFELTHGSLFVMLPGCQEQYHHRICKASGAGLRINWTFRPLISTHEQRDTAKTSGDHPEAAQPDHRGNRSRRQPKSTNSQETPLPTSRAAQDKARRNKQVAPLDSPTNRPIARPLPPSTPDGRPWITGDWVEGLDDDKNVVQGTVAAEGVGYLRLMTNVAIYQPKLIHPAGSIEAKRNGILSQIESIRKQGEMMPTGCWIEAYHVTRKLKTGDKQQYKYFRVKAYQPIFEDEQGNFKRSKNLGDVSSKAYQDWCQRRHRREQINQLQKQLSKLDRECNNKSPPEKFVVYHVPQAWFEGNNVHWGGIPDDYEPTGNYREYRKKQ